MLTIRAKILVAFLLLSSYCGYAQYDFEAVLPGLTGDALRQQLVQDYKPTTVLDFGDAKDIMYGEIYALNDSVRGVYSGHTLYLDPDEDPSQFLYLDGSPNGINAEHTYPKSKGADSGNAISDLYNLFPSRTQVNADRGNLPFGEIDDSQTSFWYYLDGKSSQIPADMIDAYSEVSNQFFEPREDHKGNVARSIFYFVTMYQEEVMAADPGFFDQMRETLCAWHYADPVDSLEWVRNEKIASYQSGRKNPYILDCSLAGRLFCDYVDDACTAVPTQKLTGFVPKNKPADIFPNPFLDRINIVVSPASGLNKVIVYNLLGEQLFSCSSACSDTYSEGNGRYAIDLTKLLNGVYILEFELNQETGDRIKTRQVIIKQRP